MLADSTK